MLGSFLKLFSIFSARQKRDFYILQTIMLMTALTELIGVASIFPFMSVAASPNLIESSPYLAKLSDFLGAPSEKEFLLHIGGIFMMLIIASNSLLISSQYFMNRYSHRLGGEFSNRLYSYYLCQPTIYHANRNSADLIQHILRDANRISNSFIAPALRLNARFFSIVLLSGMLVWVNYVVAIASLLSLGVIYWFIFYFLRNQIYKNGKNITMDNAQRNRILNESFEGIKEVKLFAIEAPLLDQFYKLTKRVSRSSANNKILGQSPYYIVETAVLVGVILVTLFFATSKDDFDSAIPLLTLYCMTGFKLVPKIQQSYLAVTKIKGSEAAFKSVYDTLKLASESKEKFEQKTVKLTPEHSIQLKNIWFKYPDAIDSTLENLSLTINLSKTTAITGESGNGKSTLLDIMMGLNTPDQGAIYIGNCKIGPGNLASWRRCVGYVPQLIYVSDTTIANNVAFGEEQEFVDRARVLRALEFAGLSTFVSGLPYGMDTFTGERGAQLSGGQKQRLGIARALYRKIDVLVLDEATSALDNVMQREVLEKIKYNLPELTIIMVTHREETLTFADDVYELKNKQVHLLPKQEN